MQKIESADILAGELVLDGKAIGQMMMQIFMRGDTTLKSLLSAEEYAVIKKEIDAKSPSLAPMFERIRPIFSSMILQEDLMEKAKTNEKKKAPLDLYLQSEAKKMGKEVIGLETVQEQINVFNFIPLQEQAKMLYQEVLNKDVNAEKNAIEKLTQLYISGDIDSLYLFSVQSMSAMMNEKLLTKRNEVMVSRMVERMGKKKNTVSLFVAVGAAHLAGKEGILEKLRKRGYKVEAVN
jgi:uncharacterized protein YbaP (TraB family)